VVLHALWPSDYTAFAVFRVLIEAKWGDVAGNDNRYLFVLFVPSAFLLSLVEWQYVATPDAHRFLKKLG
jgi:hypothetical protein